MLPTVINHEHTKVKRPRCTLVLNLSLGSELVPNHPAKSPFDHVILEVWKTDKVFTFAVDYMLGVYAHIYAHIKIDKLVKTRHPLNFWTTLKSLSNQVESSLQVI